MIKEGPIFPLSLSFRWYSRGKGSLNVDAVAAKMAEKEAPQRSSTLVVVLYKYSIDMRDDVFFVEPSSLSCKICFIPTKKKRNVRGKVVSLTEINCVLTGS